MKTLTRTTFFALILMVSASQLAYAETKVYQYDGKLPFVQMMLNMMTAMGILDRLPSNANYGSYGQSGNSLSRYNNSPGAQGSLWGNPSWGVLPYESYSRNNYSSYAPYRAPYRQADDFNGWVNESWETSDWNPKAEDEKHSQSKPQATAPIVQNFNYSNSPATTDVSVAQKRQQSPLAKLVPSHQAAKNSSARSGKQLSSRPVSQQKPCVTDFCGLKKPSLNGLWVAQNGEILGVKNNQYLWSDSKSRYLTGLLKVQNEYLLASVDGHNQTMRFKYKLAGNRLLTLDPGGKVREFVRTSASQYNNVYRGGYGQNYGNSYYQ